jgi:energy-coupling factor transporter ATP-binding protein EcfA2
VDEALGVGDIAFQQKCFKYMKKFVDAGKVLIFVSHDVTTMRGFCKRGFVLHNGQIVMDAEFSFAAEFYYNKFLLSLDVQNKNNESLSHTYYYENFSKLVVRIKNDVIMQQDWVEVDFELSPLQDIEELGIGVFLSNYKLEEILGVNNYMYNKSLGQLQKEKIAKVSFRFRLPIIADGDYFLGFSICDGTMAVNRQLIRNNSLKSIKVIQKYPQLGRGFYVYNPHEDVEILC